MVLWLLVNYTEALIDRQRVRRRTNDDIRPNNVDLKPTHIPGHEAPVAQPRAEFHGETDPITSDQTIPKSSMGGSETAKGIENKAALEWMDGVLSRAGDNEDDGSKIQWTGAPKSRKISRRATGSTAPQMDEWMDQLLKRNGVYDNNEESIFAEDSEKTTPKTIKGSSKPAIGGTPELSDVMEDVMERNGIINDGSTLEKELLSSKRIASKSIKGAKLGTYSGTTKMDEWMESFLARNGVHDEVASEIPNGPPSHANDSISINPEGRTTPMEDWMTDFLNRNGVDDVDHLGGRWSKSGKDCRKSKKTSKLTCGPSSITLTPSPSLSYVSGKSGKGNKGTKTSKRSSSKRGNSLSPAPALASQSPSPSPQGKGSSKLKGSKQGKQNSISPAPTLASQSLSPSPQGKSSSRGKGKKQGKKSNRSKSSSAKAAQTPTASPSSTEQPSPFPSSDPSEQPSIDPSPAPTTIPSASPSEAPPTVAPVTRVPTTGTVVLNNFCSNYESVLGTPTVVEFADSAGLTCDHIEQVLTGTLEMAAPGVLDLEIVSCSPVSRGTNPVEICFEVATVFSVDSSVVLTSEEIGELICIAISEPAVDALLTELAQLPTSNPFSGTTGLTCDASAVPSGAPTRAPVAGSTPAPISTRRYEITQELLMPTQDKPVFESAATRWESIIIGDVEDYDSSRLPEPPLPGCTYPDVIDDLYICGVIEAIDGSGNQVGSGRANFLRNDNNLPVAGEMVFDVDDLDLIRDLGLLEDLVLHEMGKCIFLSV